MVGVQALMTAVRDRTKVAGVRDDRVQDRLRAVRRPRPILDRRRERALTERQRELLDQLGHLFEEGFADLTMAEIAGRLSCSLRTLYALAPSRDELVLVVVDRNLWKVGRAARDAIGSNAIGGRRIGDHAIGDHGIGDHAVGQGSGAADVAPLDALRAYLATATVAVQATTSAFSRDLAAVPAARQLGSEHDEYLFEITRTLLDLAVERGEIHGVDTAAVARVLAGMGSFFSRPAVIPTLRGSPKEAADEVVDLVLRGLRADTPAGHRSTCVGGRGIGGGDGHRNDDETDVHATDRGDRHDRRG